MSAPLNLLLTTIGYRPEAFPNPHIAATAAVSRPEPHWLLVILFPPRSWAFLAVGIPDPKIWTQTGVSVFRTHEL